MKIIVIGGVAAGMSAAAKAKRTDPSADITVYEKGGYLSYGACGLPYYVGGVNNDHTKLVARTREQFEKAGIHAFLHHQVTRVEPDKKQLWVTNLETGEQRVDHYDKLMVAVGANAVMPPFAGRELDGICLLKTMEDGLLLHEMARRPKVRQVVVVGGGYIGVECAEAFLQLGKKVRIIEAAPRLLMPFDAEMAEFARQELAAKGVQIHLDEKVDCFTGEDEVRRVMTDKGSYEADLVVVAVGVRPATSFLQDTGIAMAKNGALLVNSYLETSIPDIYAAGDCILCYNKLLGEGSYLALGTVANKCGRIAGENMVGGRREFTGALGSAAIKVCDIELVRTGLGEADAQRLGLAHSTVMVEEENHASFYPGAAAMYIKLIYEKQSKKILGAQLCGGQGTVLRGNMFATAIDAGMTTTQLGMADMAYAPPFSGVWDAVLVACNAAK